LSSDDDVIDEVGAGWGWESFLRYDELKEMVAEDYDNDGGVMCIRGEWWLLLLLLFLLGPLFCQKERVGWVVSSWYV
jgi:hypothetical protein